MIRNRDFVVLLFRLFLGYLFFSSGICKLTHGHFGQIIGPPWLEQRLAKFNLGLFAQVIAYCQVVFGALLLTPRFSTLGAILLVPMNVCILAVTVSLKWPGTPYINGLVLALNLLVLAYEFRKFQFLIKPLPGWAIGPVPLDAFRAGYLNWVVLLCALLTMLAAPFQYGLTNLLGTLTFVVAGLALCLPPHLNQIQKVMVVLAVGNMLLITAFGRLHKVPHFLLALNFLLVLLLGVNLYRRFREKSRAGVLEV